MTLATKPPRAFALSMSARMRCRMSPATPAFRAALIAPEGVPPESGLEAPRVPAGFRHARLCREILAEILSAEVQLARIMDGQGAIE
jgi:hypothetical protein